MTVRIQLPDSIAKQLQHQASVQQRSVEEVALAILEDGLVEMDTQSLEDLVATIKATPPDPQTYRPAQGSLADALHNAPSPPQDFDLKQWNAEWEAVEAEIRALNEVSGQNSMSALTSVPESGT